MVGILVEGERSRAFWSGGRVDTIYDYGWDQIVYY